LLEDSQVTSAPLRPACALSLAERPMRKRPLGIQAGFTRPERCLQCYRRKTKRQSQREIANKRAAVLAAKTWKN